MKCKIYSLLIAAILLIPSADFAENTSTTGGDKIVAPRNVLLYYPIAFENGKWPFDHLDRPPSELWFFLEDEHGIPHPSGSEIPLNLEWDTEALNELADKLNCEIRKQSLGLGSTNIYGRVTNVMPGYEFTDGFELKMIIDIRDETKPCLNGATINGNNFSLFTPSFPFMFSPGDPEYSDFILWTSLDDGGTWTDITNKITETSPNSMRLNTNEVNFPAWFRLEHRGDYSNILTINTITNFRGATIINEIHAIGGSSAPAPPPSNYSWSLAGREIIGSNQFLYIPLTEGQNPWHINNFLRPYENSQDHISGGAFGTMFLAPTEERTYPEMINVFLKWDTEAFYAVDTTVAGASYTIPLTSLKRRQTPFTVYRPDDFTGDYNFDIIVEIIPPDMPRIFGVRSLPSLEHNGYARTMQLEMDSFAGDDAGFIFNPLEDAFTLWASDDLYGEWETVSVTHTVLPDGTRKRETLSDPGNIIINPDNISVRNGLIHYHYNDLSQPLWFMVEVNGELSNMAKVFDLTVGIDNDGLPVIHTFSELRGRWGHDRDGAGDLPGTIPSPSSATDSMPGPVTVSAAGTSETVPVPEPSPVPEPVPEPSLALEPSPASEPAALAITEIYEAVTYAADPADVSNPDGPADVQIITNNTGEVILIISPEIAQTLISDALRIAAEDNGDDGSVPTVVLDISSIGNAVSASLEKDTISAFAASGVAVTLNFPDTQITLPPEALFFLTEADGIVTIEAAVVEKNALNAAQIAKLNGYGKIISVNVYAGGQKLDVPLTVSIFYSHSPDEDPRTVTVWHLDDYGVFTVKNSDYDTEAGIITFTINHQSFFVIGYYSALYQMDLPLSDVSIQDDYIRLTDNGSPSEIRNPLIFPVAGFVFLALGFSAIAVSVYLKYKGKLES